jgi:hypothetical protein
VAALNALKRLKRAANYADVIVRQKKENCRCFLQARGSRMKIFPVAGL